MKKTIVAALLGIAVSLSFASEVSAADQEGEPVIARQLQAGRTILQSGTAPFADLEGHFAADAVNRLANYQMIGMGKIGGPQPLFAPNSKADRVEFKAWIKNALGKEVADTANSPTVTRVEAATWIASTLPEMNLGINGGHLTAPYEDIENVTPTERKALNLLYLLGIMVGDGQGRFNPNGVLTRGEAAVLLDRSLARTLAVAPKVDYEKVTALLPEAVQELADANRTQPGLDTTVVDGARYVVISGGQVPTVGYSIQIDSVSETAAGIFVSAWLRHPGSGVMAQPIESYPQTILKINNTDKIVYLAQ